MSTLYNLCRINKTRQEQAAQAGIVPHLKDTPDPNPNPTKFKTTDRNPDPDWDGRTLSFQIIVRAAIGPALGRRAAH